MQTERYPISYRTNQHFVWRMPNDKFPDHALFIYVHTMDMKNKDGCTGHVIISNTIWGCDKPEANCRLYGKDYRSVNSKDIMNEINDPNVHCTAWFIDENLPETIEIRTFYSAEVTAWDGNKAKLTYAYIDVTKATKECVSATTVTATTATMTRLTTEQKGTQGGRSTPAFPRVDSPSITSTWSPQTQTGVLQTETYPLSCTTNRRYIWKMPNEMFPDHSLFIYVDTMDMTNDAGECTGDVIILTQPPQLWGCDKPQANCRLYAKDYTNVSPKSIKSKINDPSVNCTAWFIDEKPPEEILMRTFYSSTFAAGKDNKAKLTYAYIDFTEGERTTGAGNVLYIVLPVVASIIVSAFVIGLVIIYFKRRERRLRENVQMDCDGDNGAGQVGSNTVQSGYDPTNLPTSSEAGYERPDMVPRSPVTVAIHSPNYLPMSSVVQTTTKNKTYENVPTYETIA